MLKSVGSPVSYTHLVQRGRGYILNVSSSAGFLPGPLMATYYATKNYVLRLTEALRLSLIHISYDKRVCDVEPIGSTADYLNAYPVFTDYPNHEPCLLYTSVPAHCPRSGADGSKIRRSSCRSCRSATQSQSCP